MKSVILVMVAVLMLMSWACHQAEAVLCPDIGWGGCADGGCYRCGGYCVNHGRPPNNNCICENRSDRNQHRGGLLAYMRSDLAGDRNTQVEFKDIESLEFEVNH